MKPYEDLYGRLLFDRPFRERLRSGDWSELGALAETFADVDFDQLEHLSGEIRNGLLRGDLGGMSLANAFPKTLEALGGPEVAVESFLAAFREVQPYDCTGRMAGVSVLESFFAWAEPQLQPDARLAAQHEFVAALLAALARTTHPGFLVRWPPIRQLGAHWLCVLDAARPLEGPADQAEQPQVYAVVAGRYTTGDLAKAFAAIALEGEPNAPAWVAAERAAMPPRTQDEWRSVLAMSASAAG